MGMTTEQFDALATSDSRYFLQWGDDCCELVDRTDGVVVFNDRMEPEDAILSRDLFPLVEMLNSLAAAETRARADGMMEGLTKAAEIADRVASSPYGAGYPGAVISGGPSPTVLGDRIHGARSVEAAILAEIARTP